MLLQLPDVLAPQELAQARSLLAAADWVDGRTTAGDQAATVKHNQQLPARSEHSAALQQLVLGALDRQPLFFSAALPRRILPPMFNRHSGDANRYGRHVDQAVRQLPGQGGRLRADISCTLFLTAPDEYDGGELQIDEGFGNRRIKLPAGHLLLYPAGSVHSVEPVTRGERLASFFWVESMVRSAEQRRLLYDFDLQLMRLRERLGECDETVALTGTYHNLLRQWVDA
jgi:PKHD-type hydroxylase